MVTYELCRKDAEAQGASLHRDVVDGHRIYVVTAQNGKVDVVNAGFYADGDDYDLIDITVYEEVMDYAIKGKMGFPGGVKVVVMFEAVTVKGSTPNAGDIIAGFDLRTLEESGVDWRKVGDAWVLNKHGWESSFPSLHEAAENLRKRDT